MQPVFEDYGQPKFERSCNVFRDALKQSVGKSAKGIFLSGKTTVAKVASKTKLSILPTLNNGNIAAPTSESMIFKSPAQDNN